jgi:predicted  nucleic acid-binding Zn-ribbon protein
MRYLWIVLAAPAIAGCYAKERKAAGDTISTLRTEVDQLRIVAAQKDTVMMEVNEAQRFIDEVNMELSKIRKDALPKAGGPAGDMSATAAKEQRASMLKRLQDLSTRIAQNDAKLKAALSHVDSLTALSSALRNQLASFEQMITAMRTTVDQQQRDIAAITDTVSSLKKETVRLNTANTVLHDTVSALTTRENMVYFVVGTKKDLLAQGLVAEEGGTRILIFGRHGKTLVPATTLDASKFRAVDRRTETVINLPPSKKGYRVVSRQNLMYLDSIPDKDGLFHDKLVIRDPTSFWAASPYLIVVSQD